ncbi:MAG: High-affnity carbon uptake protein Hat/HatR [Bacteroidetes bacterium]|nr:High-affnity carbon uptake protein Hat/HatR [Bacteroidota bacterium]
MAGKTKQKAAKPQNTGSGILFNPYPGLRPFKLEESHLFFGREGQTDEVLQKLAQHRFVGIIGPSGSGKSSFVYCGVLPILFGGFLAKTGPNWDVIILRPGSSPIENLASALLEKDPAFQGEPEDDHNIRKTIITTLLRSDSQGLVEAIKQIKQATNKNYLILVDQFEELFRYKANIENKYSVDDTLTFINLLMQTVDSEEDAYYVAITMRSDFIGDCAQFANLTRKINDSHYLIPQLTREQKRKAIEGPAAVANGENAQRLVNRLLNDLGDNPDQLPILQHALMRTWDYWSKNREGNEILDLKHYEAIGTMSEALSQHADEAYHELDEKQKKICEALFKAITEKRGTFGIRRPTLLKDIAAMADCKNKELADVIITFRKPGRSFLTPQHGVKLSPNSIIDISHESLMRIWKRLKNWVDEESEAVGMYMRLAEAAAMYQVGKSGLWRPPDLQLALNWQVKHKPTLVWGQRYDAAFERTMSFLEYSKKEYDNEQRVKELQAKRRLRNARITVIVLASATVISIAFLLYAFAQKTQADRSLVLAVAAQFSADSSSVEANIQKDSALFQKEQADIFAKEASFQQRMAELSSDSAKVARDSAVVASNEAIRQKGIAESQTIIAQRQTILADSSARIATKNEKLATEQSEIATRERFLALAKGLGSKAGTGNIPDPQLRGLMALQGYIFNNQYEGSAYEADIFSGLHRALTEFEDPITLSLIGHKKEIYAAHTSRINNAIYTGDTRGKILKWTFNNGISQPTVIEAGRGAQLAISKIEDIAVSNDGRWLVAVGEFKSEPTQRTTYLEVHDLTNNSRKTIEGVINEASAVVITPDNRFIIFKDNNGQSIRKVGINGGSISTLFTAMQELMDFDLNPAGNLIAAVGISSEIVILDAGSGKVLTTFPSDDGKILESVKFSPDGRYLAYGDEDGAIILLNASDYSMIKRFTDHTGIVHDIDFNMVNGKSTFMSSASNDKSTRIYNLESLNEIPVTYTESRFVYSTAFSPDNNFVFAGSEREELKALPTHASIMADKMCTYITRNMSDVEWEAHVGVDIEYENTCIISANLKNEE